MALGGLKCRKNGPITIAVLGIPKLGTQSKPCRLEIPHVAKIVVTVGRKCMQIEMSILS